MIAPTRHNQLALGEPDLFTRRENRAAIEAQRPASDDAVNAVILTLKQFAALPEPQRWVKGKEIIESLGWSDHENSHRKLRKIAEQNRDRIVSSDAGYCLIRNATIAEAAHAYRRLFSQGRNMLKAAIKQRHALHRALHE